MIHCGTCQIIGGLYAFLVLISLYFTVKWTMKGD